MKKLYEHVYKLLITVVNQISILSIGCPGAAPTGQGVPRTDFSMTHSCWTVVFLVFSWRTLVEVWRTPCLQNPCRGANRTRESWWHETIRLSHHKYPYTGRRHLKSKSCKRIRNLIRAGKAGLETRDDRWRQFQFCVFDFQPWLLSKHPHCSFRASIAASHR